MESRYLISSLALFSANEISSSEILSIAAFLALFSSVDDIKVNEYPIYLRTKKFKIGMIPKNGGYFHDLTLIENLKAIGEIQIEIQHDMNS